MGPMPLIRDRCSLTDHNPASTKSTYNYCCELRPAVNCQSGNSKGNHDCFYPRVNRGNTSSIDETIQANQYLTSQASLVNIRVIAMWFETVPAGMRLGHRAIMGTADHLQIFQPPSTQNSRATCVIAPLSLVTITSVFFETKPR